MLNVAPYLAKSLEMIAKEIRSDNCAAILCQDYEHPLFDLAILLGWRTRTPVFAIFQGHSSDWNPFGRALRPLTMRHCSGFLIGPTAEAKRIRDEYGIDRNKIHRFFNPLADDVWCATDRAAARAALGISTEAQVVVWHGRVDMTVKGLDVLLEAWNTVCHERQDRQLQLALLGSGPDSKKLRNRIEALGITNVLWIDQFVSDRQFIRKFLAAGDIYAFPSRYEGMPVAPTEAMACGLPVVASDASGVRDIFENGEDSGGLIVPTNDAGAFAQALCRLLDDKDLCRELGKRGQQRALSFSIKHAGAQLRDILQLA
jgi:glycosyltransferase involved in cell wall biosynthesis